MKSRLVIVADLGRLKAFRMQEDPAFSNPRLQLVEDMETHITNRLSEEVTGPAGRYRKGTNDTHSVLSDGEQHNIDLERRRRAVKMLARKMDELLQNEDGEGCYFAADSRITQPILDEMSPESRRKVTKMINANLSKLDPEQVISHFSE